MFVRFVTALQDPESRSFTGLFVHVYEALESSRLMPHEEELLRERLDWFKMHLKVPACLSENGNERAICWFKPEAHRPLDYAWDMIAVLREHGLHIEMIKTKDPGTILYEDGWQVVAKPHRNNRLRGRRP